MIITYEGGENFTIKTKSKTVKIGNEISLGELKISSPGEYEAGGVQLEIIDGIIEILSERMTIAWMKKSSILKDEELEKLNGINVLLIGVGGEGFSETKVAIDVIGQIDPAIVIPMGTDLSSFLKEEGITAEGIDQFKFNLNDLPSEERKVIVLKPQ